MFQPTGLFCLFCGGGEGWICALGKAIHLAGHHGCREYVPNVAELKWFWFSSLGPFGLLWGSRSTCRWGKRVMGELDLDKVPLM